MLVSVIFSCYNEENCIQQVYNDFIKIVDRNIKYELLYVDDGSNDNTYECIKRIKSKNQFDNVCISLISFARNFGHESAMICGVDNAKGDIIICMDADGQHPVEKIPEIINEFKKDIDIVCMKKKYDNDKNFIYNFFSISFYKILRFITGIDFTTNASDFFAFTKRVQDILKKEYRYKIRMLRAIVQNLGFNKTNIYFECKNRISGKSHYNFKKLFNLALNTIVTYSFKPLAVSLFFAIIIALTLILLIATKVLYGIIFLSDFLFLIIILVLFMMLFITMYIQSRYIIVMFENVKEDPLYIIKDML